MSARGRGWFPCISLPVSSPEKQANFRRCQNQNEIFAGESAAAWKAVFGVGEKCKQVQCVVCWIPLLKVPFSFHKAMNTDILQRDQVGAVCWWTVQLQLAS